MRRGSWQAVPVKLTPKGEGLGSKPAGNGAAFGAAAGGRCRWRRVGHERERHDDGRVTGLGRKRRAGAAWEQQRVELVRGHHLGDAVRPAEPHVLGAIGFPARAIGLDVHLVRDVELRLPVLDCRARRVREVERAQLGERLHRRRRPERRQPGVEVALHPVLEHHRAVRVLALGVVQPAAGAPRQEVLRLVRIDDARNVGRIDDDGALTAQHVDRLGHRLRARLVQAAARLFRARRRQLS